MSKEVLSAIGAGLASAVAAIAFLSGTFMALGFVYLAPLPMLMAGLAYGPRAAGISALVGTIALSVFGGSMVAVTFAVIHGLPVWVIVKLALTQGLGRTGASGQAAVNWMPPGEIVSAMVLFTAVALVTAAFAVEDNELSVFVAEHLGQVLGQMAPGLSATDRGRTAQAMTPLFPGAVATIWVAMAAINTVIAQGCLVRIGRNQRPSPSYVGLQLPGWTSWPLVIIAALALVGQGEWEYIGRNLTMVLALPYFFLGLAVFHTLARQVSATKPVLVVFYLVIVISVWAALVVAGIGIVEQWFGLRNRIASAMAGNGQTDE